MKTLTMQEKLLLGKSFDFHLFCPLINYFDFFFVCISKQCGKLFRVSTVLKARLCGHDFLIVQSAKRINRLFHSDAVYIHICFAVSRALHRGMLMGTNGCTQKTETCLKMLNFQSPTENLFWVWKQLHEKNEQALEWSRFLFALHLMATSSNENMNLTSWTRNEKKIVKCQQVSMERGATRMGKNRRIA
jgi:hypothetical protein